MLNQTVCYLVFKYQQHGSRIPTSALIGVTTLWAYNKAIVENLAGSHGGAPKSSFRVHKLNILGAENQFTHLKSFSFFLLFFFFAQQF